MKLYDIIDIQDLYQDSTGALVYTDEIIERLEKILKLSDIKKIKLKIKTLVAELN